MGSHVACWLWISFLMPAWGSGSLTSFVPAACPNFSLPSIRSLAKGAKCAVIQMRQKEKQLWIEPLVKDVLLASIERGYTTFAFRDQKLLKEWQGLACFQGILVEEDRLVDAATEQDIGRWMQITGRDTQSHAISLAGKEDLVVLDSQDWKIIPAENLIAAFQSTHTRLLAVVSSVEEAKIMLETLEVGTDGIILRTDRSSEIFALNKLLQQPPNQKLVDCEVIDVRPVGMGDRVCVDTCSLLGEDEGLLVGSAAQGLFLVLSEAASSQYVPSRPFRVNAGPVHSYCLCPGKTKYLGELRAGDEVLVVSAIDGKARVVTVGRVKIERRPLLLVEAERREREGAGDEESMAGAENKTRGAAGGSGGDAARDKLRSTIAP